jgi:hypothetical protein
MTKKQVILLVLAAFVLFAADYFLQPGVAPPGQQAVVSLSNQNFATFQQAFDADTGVPRLVLLLSPT